MISCMHSVLDYLLVVDQKSNKVCCLLKKFTLLNSDSNHKLIFNLIPNISLYIKGIKIEQQVRQPIKIYW